MAMIGLPKSESVMPVARQRARAPAMLRPEVDVAERRVGMGQGYACGGGDSFAGRPVKLTLDRRNFIGQV
ncbi:hypothetical protein NSI01_46940 [Pimelobacter simplex]|nr:hypothetical protein NSI01_46940 [Pimelobacter simplex]